MCRDFAHLMIAFCRCLNIPARYVNGYLGDIGVPPDPAPMDFSAWVEVFLDHRWYTFDPRHNAPRIGRIVVARGRDATDVRAHQLVRSSHPEDASRCGPTRRKRRRCKPPTAEASAQDLPELAGIPAPLPSCSRHRPPVRSRRIEHEETFSWKALPPPSGAFLGSPGFKFFLICGLVLILAIPLLLVWALIEERENRAASVRGDVAREWGAAQAITGPVLIVPYTVRRVTTQGDKRVEELVEQRAVFLPQTLNINGKAATKVLHRSIYDVAVYTATLDFEGSFDTPDMAEVAADVQSVRWHDADPGARHQRRLRAEDDSLRARSTAQPSSRSSRASAFPATTSTASMCGSREPPAFSAQPTRRPQPDPPPCKASTSSSS